MLTEGILNYSKNQNVNLRKFKIYTHWLAGWQVGRLAGWQVGRLAGWQVGRLAYQPKKNRLRIATCIE
ncbi:hypothetical protein [Erwinia persicina]|uniref:hypothetical protein n=1 Tax=Erwinia persicina TaxID=55211 RepID=UPI001FCEEC51|nr:hypothetical protein [Erwinia persicina]